LYTKYSILPSYKIYVVYSVTWKLNKTMKNQMIVRIILCSQLILRPQKWYSFILWSEWVGTQLVKRSWHFILQRIELQKNIACHTTIRLFCRIWPIYPPWWRAWETSSKFYPPWWKMSETFPKSIHLGKENEKINQNLSSLVKNIRPRKYHIKTSNSCDTSSKMFG